LSRKKKIEKREKKQEPRTRSQEIKTKKRSKDGSPELIRKLSAGICAFNLRKSAGIL